MSTTIGEAIAWMAVGYNPPPDYRGRDGVAIMRDLLSEHRKLEAQVAELLEASNGIPALIGENVRLRAECDALRADAPPGPGETLYRDVIQDDGPFGADQRGPWVLEREAEAALLPPTDKDLADALAFAAKVENGPRSPRSSEIGDHRHHATTGDMAVYITGTTPVFVADIRKLRGIIEQVRAVVARWRADGEPELVECADELDAALAAPAGDEK